MEAELKKLQIDKSYKARRDERSAWPWVLLAVLVLGAGGGAWQWRNASAAPVVQTIRVRVPEGAAAEAQRVVFNATGYVMAAHKIELASKVIGRVAWVGVEMGDKITRGQVLVRLEDDEYKARVAQQQGLLDNAKALLAELEAGSRPQEIATAQAKLDQALAELHNAQVNLKRLKSLEGSNGVSAQQVDDADALVRSRTAAAESQRQQYELVKAGPRKEQIDAQRATVRQLEGGLQTWLIDLGNTVISSPISATVLQRNVEVGEFVTNGFVGDRGAKGYVLSIADLNDLRVELDVSQNDFAKVAARQPCWIVTDAYPDKKYEGVVDLISPEANRQKATVQVRVKVLSPDDLLKPDMNATVSFLSPAKSAADPAAATQPSTERPAIRVPATAVRDNTVFVVENGKAVKRAVTATKTGSDKEMEIRKGLIGGEDLIISPPESLEDGAKVKATDASGTKGGM
ncbi:MAG: efflux transporter, family, subunit [Phycisphaerales bacterium]|nr:efflux transporter, family, subunit [Phycisphaerales bacterium]